MDTIGVTMQVIVGDDVIDLSDIVAEYFNESTQCICELLARKINDLEMTNVGNSMYYDITGDEEVRHEIEKNEKTIKELYTLLHAVCKEVDYHDIY